MLKSTFICLFNVYQETPGQDVPVTRNSYNYKAKQLQQVHMDKNSVQSASSIKFSVSTHLKQLTEMWFRS